MQKNKISIKVGGPAGSGVFTIGLLISKFFQKMGLYTVYTTDYPSLIKGGHNTCCSHCSNSSN
jgi:2-oxoglutarate ferredoxin oxidoreductase subunit alpha